MDLGSSPTGPPPTEEHLGTLLRLGDTTPDAAAAVPTKEPLAGCSTRNDRWLRQGQKLRRFAERYTALRLDDACRRALAFDLIDVRRIDRRLERAGFERVFRLENFDWTVPLTIDRRLLGEVFSLRFLARHEHALFVGPVGVGKTFLVQDDHFPAVGRLQRLVSWKIARVSLATTDERPKAVHQSPATS